MRISFICFAVSSLLLLAAPTSAQSRPRIEVAFALDATGSMGPYIQQARERIQAISAELAQGEPPPDIRFGLVTYRDRTDDYVHRVHPFTSEIHVMQRYLNETQPRGGGDTPEAVLEGLYAAITELRWTPPQSDDSTVRLLFLVGDAPAQHYPGARDEAAVAREARRRGIVLHSIVCGRDMTDQGEHGFEQLARYSEGRLFFLSEGSTMIAGVASGPSLGATVASTTRAYSSSAGVDFDPASGATLTTSPLAQSAGSSPVPQSGLLGAEPRWVHDAATLSDLWAIHTSLLPEERRPAVPEVNFNTHAVLVLGGDEAGLELVELRAAGGRRRAVLRTGAPGARFVLVPMEVN